MQSYRYQLTVLLVGENLTEQTNKILKLRQAGYNVLTSSSGREGFRQIRRESPDLVLCETDMPGICGLKLCRMIRDDIYMSTTPVVLIGAAFDDVETIKAAFDAGADDYLPAYFDSQYLVAKADWLIRKKGAVEKLKEQYEIVRSRQTRITNVIKETSGLMKGLDSELKNDELRVFPTEKIDIGIDKRIDLGIGMISAIADLLEEQTKAMNVWENASLVKTHPTLQ